MVWHWGKSYVRCYAAELLPSFYFLRWDKWSTIWWDISLFWKRLEHFLFRKDLIWLFIRKAVNLSRTDHFSFFLNRIVLSVQKCCALLSRPYSSRTISSLSETWTFMHAGEPQRFYKRMRWCRRDVDFICMSVLSFLRCLDALSRLLLTTSKRFYKQDTCP